jgi:hypothetical protein
VFERFSFVHLLIAAFVVAFIAGFALFVLSGATTDRGTTGAISAEYHEIVSAEHASCAKHGHYASLSTLEKEQLLTFKPVYNSVVYLPGAHCGSIIVGSSAYQSAAG